MTMKRRNFLAGILSLPILKYIPKYKPPPKLVMLTLVPKSYYPNKDEEHLLYHLSDGTICRAEDSNGENVGTFGKPEVYRDINTGKQVRFELPEGFGWT